VARYVQFLTIFFYQFLLSSPRPSAFISHLFERARLHCDSCDSLVLVCKSVKAVRCIVQRMNRSKQAVQQIPMTNVVSDINLQVKPLGVIWGRFPQWNQTNTIMFDDMRRNFIMNPQSGLKVNEFLRTIWCKTSIMYNRH
jgi:hypothetical protein